MTPFAPVPGGRASGRRRSSRRGLAGKRAARMWRGRAAYTVGAVLLLVTAAVYGASLLQAAPDAVRPWLLGGAKDGFHRAAALFTAQVSALVVWFGLCRPLRRSGAAWTLLAVVALGSAAWCLGAFVLLPLLRSGVLPGA